MLAFDDRGPYSSDSVLAELHTPPPAIETTVTTLQSGSGYNHSAPGYGFIEGTSYSSGYFHQIKKKKNIYIYIYALTFKLQFLDILKIFLLLLLIQCIQRSYNKICQWHSLWIVLCFVCARHKHTHTHTNSIPRQDVPLMEYKHSSKCSEG